MILVVFLILFTSMWCFFLPYLEGLDLIDHQALVVRRWDDTMDNAIQWMVQYILQSLTSWIVIYA